MTTTCTLTGDLRTVLGAGATAISASIGTNLGDVALVDLDGQAVHLPQAAPVPLTEGAFSLELIATNSTGTNVLDDTLRYVLTVEYRDAQGKRRSWNSGYFELTADRDLSDAIGMAYVEPDLASQVLAQMTVMLGGAEASAAAADGSADAAASSEAAAATSASSAADSAASAAAAGGDTGSRDVTALLAGIDPASTGKVRVRRVRNVVTWSFTNVLLTPGVGTLTMWTAIPPGFRPGVNGDGGWAGGDVFVINSLARANRIVVFGASLAWMNEVTVGTNTITGSQTHPAVALQGQFSYTTDATWPSTLPGTAG